MIESLMKLPYLEKLATLTVILGFIGGGLYTLIKLIGKASIYLEIIEQYKLGMQKHEETIRTMNEHMIKLETTIDILKEKIEENSTEINTIKNILIRK